MGFVSSWHGPRLAAHRILASRRSHHRPSTGRRRARRTICTIRGPFTQIMKAFRTALIHDLNADGFADMYAQTVAYGLLSARIADPRRKTVDDFAAHMRKNPFLCELMETFLNVGGTGREGEPSRH